MPKFIRIQSEYGTVYINPEKIMYVRFSKNPYEAVVIELPGEYIRSAFIPETLLALGITGEQTIATKDWDFTLYIEGSNEN